MYYESCIRYTYSYSGVIIVKTARAEFIELMTHNSMSNGLDELSSKIMGTLFIEPCEISLEELATKTGYSLSAVSTSSKLLESLGAIKRLKKPKSKKVFYFMEKDMFGTFIRMLKQKKDTVVRPSLKKLPEIIAQYKTKKNQSKAIEKELKIVENYYNQLKAHDSITDKMVELLEEAYDKHVLFKKPKKN